MLGKMALEQRERFTEFRCRRSKHPVQPELMRCLADPLAGSVASDKRSCVETEQSESLRIAQIEDLRDADVDVEDGARTHQIAGHTLYAVDQ